MTESSIILTIASAGLVAFGIVSTALLRGWSGWLAVRRLELENRGRKDPSCPGPTRTELASLKERVRKLEAIANGVDS